MPVTSSRPRTARIRLSPVGVSIRIKTCANSSVRLKDSGRADLRASYMRRTSHTAASAAAQTPTYAAFVRALCLGANRNGYCRQFLEVHYRMSPRGR